MKTTILTNDYLLSILASLLVVLIIIPTVAIRLIIYIIDLKYKIKVKFNLFRFHQLASIEILKLNSEIENTKLFEIYIDRLWLSSCYLNRQVGDRIVLCLNNVSINYYIHQKDETNKSNKYLTYLTHFYIKYIGSLNIESLNLKSISENFKLNTTLSKLKIESIKVETIDKKKSVIKINYSNLNLKINNKKFELNVHLNIKQTDLNIDIASFFKNTNTTSTRFFDYVNSIELYMENASCLVNSNNKLINLDLSYEENYYLIDYLNKIDFSSFKKSKSSSPNSGSILLNKIQVVSIRNYQCKILSNQSIDKNKKIKLDEIKYVNSQNEKYILAKNLIYSTEFQNRNKFNLLTKFLIGLNNKSNELIIECENLNPYFHFKFIKDLINSSLLRSFINNPNKQNHGQLAIKSFNLKIINSYLHLNDDSMLIYSFGASRLSLSKNNVKHELIIDVRQPIIFKSTLSTNNKENKFLNNLFEMISINSSYSINKNKHYWGTLINIDNFQFRKTNNSLAVFTIGSLAIEYSTDNINLVNYIIDFYKQINNLNILTEKTTKAINRIKLSIKSIDFYLLYNYKYLIDFHLKNLNYKHLNQEFSLTVDTFTGIKYTLNQMNKTNNLHYYCCLIEEEKNNLSSLVFLIEDINLNQNLNTHYLTIKTVQMTWSLETHYILFETIFKLYENTNTIRMNKKQTNKTLKLLVESDILLNLEFDFAQDSSRKQPINSFYIPSTMLQPQTDLIPKIQIISIVLNDSYLAITLNESDLKIIIKEISMFIQTNHVSEFFTDTELSTSTDSLIKQRLQNDSNKRQFLSLKSFEILNSNKTKLLTYERSLLNTSTQQNRLTLIKMDLFNFNFIFNYCFAKLIDHIFNVRKCLYKMHNIISDKRKLTTYPDLSPDLMINIKKFQLTIEDDPFEIKLAYNYALIFDEHIESVKRRETLEQRRLIKEQNLEKEALEILKEHESLIYMQRSNIIYGRNQKFKSQQQQQRAIRTELFCFAMDNLELYALADSDWHSRDKCYDLLRKLDKSSPLPSAASHNSHSYIILWCRYVNFSFDELKFLFRDYTQPLLKVNKANLFGHLVGAELEPASRARRDVKMSIFNNINDENVCFNIERSMSPIKFYHDFCSKMNLFQIAYGPCWEGTMAQFNLALDKIIHPPRDPSKPMPWWDKSRLYLHGNFSACLDQLQIIYHVSMDPYNRTEEMKWVWTQLYYDWTNMQMIFKGDLDIFLNTESKYDDCRFLHLPNLEMKLKIDWKCKSNKMFTANSHNDVMPCAPDKLPVIINSSEHDSFAFFRSENVNISLSFICNLAEQQQVPTCKFYASTSRFIQRIKTLLSTITRPIRRGKLFRNFKLRKPILSRHFKLVNINFDIPKLNVIYWSSASEEYGMCLECEHFKLNSSHKLELVPFIDTLKRRPKPCWSIEIMKCKLAQTTIYLMGPLNKNTTNHQNNTNSATPTTNTNNSITNNNNTNNNNNEIKFLESERITKSFFMQIDSIFYEREKTLNSIFVVDKSNKNDISLDDESTQNDELNDELALLSSTLNDERKTRFLSYSFKSKSKSNEFSKTDNNSLHLRNRSESFKSVSPSKKSSSITFNNKFDPKKMSQKNSLGFSRPGDEATTLKNVSNTSIMPFKVKQMPKHNIQVKNLKAKWNNVNRDVIYILYEIYNKSKRLRHNISSQALKEYDLLTDQIVQGYALNNSQSQINLSRKSSIGGNNSSLRKPIDLPGGLNAENINTNTFFEQLLNKLDAEREINSEIYCDEKKIVESSNYNDLLYGVHAANKMSDIISENIFIEFINSQVKLSLESDSLLSDSSKLKNQQPPPPLSSKLKTKQSDNSSTFDCLNDENYLIISAAKANVVQRLHKPVWKSQRLLDKASWNGYLEGMQYFATLDSFDDKPSSNKQLLQIQNEYWLPDDIIDLSEQIINNQTDSTNKSTMNKHNNNDEEISISSSSGGSSSAPIVITAAETNTNQNKNNLGMLIAYNTTNPTPNTENNVQTLNKQKAEEGVVKEKRTRFGFGKSNRKLTKPDLTNDLNRQDSKNTNTNNRYLQLIVSNCRCEFYMIDFDDKIPNTDEYSNQSSSSNNSSFNYSQLYQKIERQASIDENLAQNFKSSSHNTLNSQIDLNATFNEPIDCFSLIHYDLNLCTNSKQYKMIMNLVNNLVLYFRPRRKQVINKQKSIKFNLQLSMGNLDSLKTHIQQMQIEAKELLCKIRAMERKLYHLREKIQNEIRFYQENKSIDPITCNNNQLLIIHELNNENVNMEKDYRDNKNRLNELSDELNISISCYKEIILEKRAYTLANTSQYNTFNNINDLNSVYVSPTQNMTYFTNRNKFQQNNKFNSEQKNAKKLNESLIKLEQAQQSILNNEVGKRYEIWFKNTQWNLNEDDGQTGCAQFLMKNFLYTKVTNQQELDCVEHTLEVESCKLKDLSEFSVSQNSSISSSNNNNNNNNKKKDKSNKILDNFVLAGLFDDSLSDLDESLQEYEQEETTTTTNSNIQFNDLSVKSENDSNFDDLLVTKNTKKISCLNENNLMSSAINNNSTMFRVYCKERPPVGIPVFEHIELNSNFTKN